MDVRSESANTIQRKAEKWLQDEAQALGWSKLSKLEGRATKQGLVGIAFDGRKAAMVEINCETDFVGRNKHFKDMVDLASVACLQFAKHPEPNDDLLKVRLESEMLKTIKSSDGKTLADHVALLVSTVGENVSLRRAVCVSTSDSLNLGCYIHPQAEGSHVVSGRYGSIVMYSAPKCNAKTEQTARQLCQHIVGMNPKTIYKDTTEGTATINKDPSGGTVKNEKVSEDSSDGTDVTIIPEIEEDAMMSQDFLLDPNLTVEQALEESGIKVYDFVRFEIGERIVSDEDTVPKIKASQAG